MDIGRKVIDLGGEVKTFKTILIFVLILAGAGGTYYYYDQFNGLKNDQDVEVSDVEITESKKVVVYGDSRTGHDEHKSIVAEIEKQDPYAVIHTGDLVDDGDISSEWDTFNEITSELLSDTWFYSALGNHDKNSDNYFSNLVLPGNERYYSVNIDNVHYTVLDSNYEIGPGSDQYIWAEADLKNAVTKSDFQVAVLHHPPYSTGGHGDDESGMRDKIVPLLEKYGVDLVFSGHDHSYERADNNNIVYIVAGGGGAPLYPQKFEKDYSKKYLESLNFCVLETDDTDLVMTAYNELSEVIDKIVIKK